MVAAGLGTLNHTELTVGALRARGLEPSGLVVGSWPAEPDLAERCNLEDLPRVTGVPLLAVIPAGAGSMPREEFVAAARRWFGMWAASRELALGCDSHMRQPFCRPGSPAWRHAATGPDGRSMEAHRASRLQSDGWFRNQR